MHICLQYTVLIKCSICSYPHWVITDAHAPQRLKKNIHCMLRHKVMRCHGNVAPEVQRWMALFETVCARGVQSSENRCSDSWLRGVSGPGDPSWERVWWTGKSSGIGNGFSRRSRGYDQADWVKKKTTQQLRETDPLVLVMSINRTRWLDKLRPAGASSGGWTEGPMAPVETTDAATVDQRCSFKHWTGWRHNHSNSNCLSPCAWVKLIFSVSRIVVFAQGPCFLHVQISSNSICACHPWAGSHKFFTRKKNDPNLCVSSLCKPYFRIVQKKLPISDLDCHSCAGAMQQYPESHHLCTEAVQQCPEGETPSSLRRSHATVSSGR